MVEKHPNPTDKDSLSVAHDLAATIAGNVAEILEA